MGKETFDQIREKIGDTHSFLAEGLTVPFINQTNNSRVQMASSQINQAIQMRESDLPLVFTGFENQVGKYSSGYRLLNGEWMVLKKFVKNPLNYVMIIQNTKTREYDLVTRKEVEHLTEIFGYELNNEEIDSVDSGDIIEDHVIYRDNNYDEDMNLKYGKNMRIAYLPYKGLNLAPSY